MAIVESIITEAIYKSLQDREFQPDIEAIYLAMGLFQVNLVLDEWRDLIPFSQTVTFDSVDNLENSAFVSVDTVNFIINTTSYLLKPVSLTQFKQLQSVIGLNGFPSIYYFDELDQTIDVYPRPSMPNYQFTVWGKIQQVTLGMFDNIPANMPPFMKNALIYEVGFRLAGELGAQWDGDKETTRQGLIRSLKNKKSINLRKASHMDFGTPSQRQIPPFPALYFMSGGGQ